MRRVVAITRIAVWLRPGLLTAPRPLYEWTSARIDEACVGRWREYAQAKESDYVAYFATHPKLADPAQAWSANSLAAALPPGWAHLGRLLPKHRHRYCLSAKSSQTLALALLGAASQEDPSHAWLWRALDPLPPATGQPPHG